METVAAAEKLRSRNTGLSQTVFYAMEPPSPIIRVAVETTIDDTIV
jgi:hypothetical protein